MTVPVVYDEIIETVAKQNKEERYEIDRVSESLAKLGYRPFPLPVNLSVDKSAFQDLGSPLVFNCVDTLDESGRFVHIVPAILDELGIPYTGSTTDAIFLTSNKVLAKRFLKLHRIRTPRWISAEEGSAGRIPFGPPYILKHVWEDASFGLDARSVIANKAELQGRTAAMDPSKRGDYFVEAFIDGREFHVSVLTGPDKPMSLPPMEVEFHGFPEGRPKIIDFEIKWDDNPAPKTYIDQRLDFPEEAAPLLQELSSIALKCWNIFRLEGFVRIDFRVDQNGVPWVLDINTNPYLGKESNFLAAAERVGLDFDDVIRILVDDALSRAGQSRL